LQILTAEPTVQCPGKPLYVVGIDESGSGDEPGAFLKDDGGIPVRRVVADMTFSTERTPTDKATFHCPECGHNSPITGDWTIHILVDSTTSECPECGTTIDSRRDRKALIAESSESHRVAVTK
jgi:predicted RNA-binding Zn-ribbon protein involved in translation (DUF1610 family)